MLELLSRDYVSYSTEQRGSRFPVSPYLLGRLNEWKYAENPEEYA
jgi:hypothetical protein